MGGSLYSRGYGKDNMEATNKNIKNEIDSLFDEKIWSLPICKVVPSLMAKVATSQEKTNKEAVLSKEKIKEDSIHQIKRIFIRNLDDALYEKLKFWLFSNNLLEKKDSKSILVYRLERGQAKAPKTDENKSNVMDQIVVVGSDLTDPFNDRDISLIESTLHLSAL